jgi:hypothetical protein
MERHEPMDAGTVDRPCASHLRAFGLGRIAVEPDDHVATSHGDHLRHSAERLPTGCDGFLRRGTGAGELQRVWHLSEERQVCDGRFDNDGYSYSSNTLNSSIQWNGMTFAIGPAGQPDAVANTTIALPGGAYTQLFMLGAMVNNITTNPVTFTVTYSDKSTATFTQSISDWFNVAGYPGESVVTCQEDRNFQDGTSEPYSVCIYGYQIPLDGTKTVESLTLPNTRDIVMLAFDLTTAAVPGNLVYTPPAGTVEPVGKNTLSVTFTPTDGPDRNPVSATVQL